MKVKFSEIESGSRSTLAMRLSNYPIGTIIKIEWDCMEDREPKHDYRMFMKTDSREWGDYSDGRCWGTEDDRAAAYDIWDEYYNYDEDVEGARSNVKFWIEMPDSFLEEAIREDDAADDIFF